jgi:hypothetical protein
MNTILLNNVHWPSYIDTQDYARIDTVSIYNNFFFLIRIVGGGVQLGPLGKAATDWPIVACPG